MQFRLEKMIKDDPNIIRNYLKTGEKPSMNAEENKRFMNYIELFRTIQASGNLEVVTILEYMNANMSD